MQINADPRLAWHRWALDAVTTHLRAVGPDDLARPSTCTGWDLRALLEHMVGQNHGFAEAVSSSEDAPVSAFAPRPLDGDGLVRDWQISADRVATAFASAPDAEAEILLPEVSTERRLPVATVLGFHLLDTAVHAWDVATTLGRDGRPPDELAELVRTEARAVPVGPARERPGAAFAPPLDGTPDDTPDDTPDEADAWTAALALLGRA